MSTQATQPAEGQKYCLILRKPDTGLSIWFYHYSSEDAARADIPKWASHDACAGYTEPEVLPEPVDRPLLGEREGQG